jgi:hypothetical protein
VRIPPGFAGNIVLEFVQYLFATGPCPCSCHCEQSEATSVKLCADLTEFASLRSQ